MRLALSRAELARRAGASTRLVAEVERGERPNVSLETALRLLDAVGIVVRLTAPEGDTSVIQGETAAALGREARAAHRRRTWTGRHVSLHASGDAPDVGRATAAGFHATARVSTDVHALAAAARARAGRRGTARRRGA